MGVEVCPFSGPPAWLTPSPPTWAAAGLVGPAEVGAGAAGAGAGQAAAEGGRRPGSAGGGAGGSRLQARAQAAASSSRPAATRRLCQARWPALFRWEGLPALLREGVSTGREIESMGESCKWGGGYVEGKLMGMGTWHKAAY